MPRAKRMTAVFGSMLLVGALMAGAARAQSSKPDTNKDAKSQQQGPSTTIAEACPRSGARWAEILEKDLPAGPRRFVDGHDDGERDPCVLAGQHGISILADGLDHVLKLDPMANLRIRPWVIDIADGEALLHIRHRRSAHVPEQD